MDEPSPPAYGPPASARNETRKSVSVAALLPGVGSGPWLPSSVTVAVLVREATPGGTDASTRTVTVRMARAPAARLNAGQVTEPPARPPPSPAATKAVDGGRTSERITPVATAAEKFATVSV